MNKVLRYTLQVFNYTLFMAIVWYFSIQPPYRQLEEGQAVVTLSFSHAAELREACRRMSQEELLKLPPNMRLPTSCPRERSPVTVELFLDKKLMTRQVVEAPGLHQDQGIDMFHRIKVPAGDHKLRVSMNDDVKVEGPTYRFEKDITLQPEEQVLVDFNANSGGFYINILPKR
ncbi:MAG: hypothetical protein OQL16_03615 [Gammaproteobacteria bacterium]|nr:hypothetical protein [Gammaproteobacteria bacterium]